MLPSIEDILKLRKNLQMMIILTNLQATATCKHEVPEVHMELCKYQIY